MNDVCTKTAHRWPASTQKHTSPPRVIREMQVKTMQSEMPLYAHEDVCCQKREKNERKSVLARTRVLGAPCTVGGDVTQC